VAFEPQQFVRQAVSAIPRFGIRDFLTLARSIASLIPAAMSFTPSRASSPPG
jgi:hypothetical protein